MAQLEGKKSRCSEVTTITNRSHHIPMLMKIEATHITYTFRRANRVQKMFGTTQLQKTISQKIGM